MDAAGEAERKSVPHHHTPGLEYASAITDPHTPSKIKILNKVQNHAVRFVTDNLRTRYTPETEHVSVSGLIDRRYESY